MEYLFFTNIIDHYFLPREIYIISNQLNEINSNIIKLPNIPNRILSTSNFFEPILIPFHKYTLFSPRKKKILQAEWEEAKKRERN